MRDLGVWDFTDANGAEVRISVKLDEGKKFVRVLGKLANRARKSPRRKSSALAGALQVEVLSDTGEKT